MAHSKTNIMVTGEDEVFQVPVVFDAFILLTFSFVSAYHFHLYALREVHNKMQQTSQS